MPTVRMYVSICSDVQSHNFEVHTQVKQQNTCGLMESTVVV